MKTGLEKPKWLTKENLIVAVLCGVLLLVICFPLGENEYNEKDNKNDILKEPENTDFLYDDNGYVITDVYQSQMEEKIRNILSAMDGVGKVEVLLTLQSSEELVVEKDTRIVRENSEENVDNGVFSVQSVDSEETTVFNQSGSSEKEPYVIKTIQPKVEGVLVIAQGAGSGEVNKNITEAIQVLFGIESHKIKVAKMKSN